MKFLSVSALIGAVLLAGCQSLVGSSNIVAGSASVWGVGAQTLPDGTLKASIGAQIVDLATVPLLDTKTDKPILVPTMCGEQNGVAVYGTITGNASAGVQTTKAPAVSLSQARGLAVGEPAILSALADVQAANPNVNALHEYHDCSLTAAAAAQPVK